MGKPPWRLEKRLGQDIGRFHAEFNEIAGP
jgi:hypothetical protein